MQDSATPPDSMNLPAKLIEISVFRLYLLRLFYLVMAFGLGVYIWPGVFHHTAEFATTKGVRIALLAGLGALATLGVRYPIRMMPILLFELAWRAIYLAAFALPVWLTGSLSDAMAEDVRACLMAVVFIPTIPWRYVIAYYVLNPGDRWR